VKRTYGLRIRAIFDRRSRTVHQRWALHVEEAFKNSKKTTRPLIKAIQDFGPDAFTVNQLDEAQSQRELNAKEVLWIAVLGTLLPRGFNATRGGQGLESGKSVVVNGVRFKTIDPLPKS
jgi:hypothetical protein